MSHYISPGGGKEYYDQALLTKYSQPGLIKTEYQLGAPSGNDPGYHIGSDGSLVPNNRAAMLPEEVVNPLTSLNQRQLERLYYDGEYSDPNTGKNFYVNPMNGSILINNGGMNMQPGMGYGINPGPMYGVPSSVPNYGMYNQPQPNYYQQQQYQPQQSYYPNQYQQQDNYPQYNPFQQQQPNYYQQQQYQPQQSYYPNQYQQQDNYPQYNPFQQQQPNYYQQQQYQPQQSYYPNQPLQSYYPQNSFQQQQANMPEYMAYIHPTVVEEVVEEPKTIRRAVYGTSFPFMRYIEVPIEEATPEELESIRPKQQQNQLINPFMPSNMQLPRGYAAGGLVSMDTYNGGSAFPVYPSDGHIPSLDEVRNINRPITPDLNKMNNPNAPINVAQQAWAMKKGLLTEGRHYNDYGVLSPGQLLGMQVPQSTTNFTTWSGSASDNDPDSETVSPFTVNKVPDNAGPMPSTPTASYYSNNSMYQQYPAIGNSFSYPTASYQRKASDGYMSNGQPMPPYWVLGAPDTVEQYYGMLNSAKEQGICIEDRIVQEAEFKVHKIYCAAKYRGVSDDKLDELIDNAIKAREATKYDPSKNPEAFRGLAGPLPEQIPDTNDIINAIKHVRLVVNGETVVDTSKFSDKQREAVVRNVRGTNAELADLNAQASRLYIQKMNIINAHNTIGAYYKAMVPDRKYENVFDVMNEPGLAQSWNRMESDRIIRESMLIPRDCFYNRISYRDYFRKTLKKSYEERVTGLPLPVNRTVLARLRPEDICRFNPGIDENGMPYDWFTRPPKGFGKGGVYLRDPSMEGVFSYKDGTLSITLPEEMRKKYASSTDEDDPNSTIRMKRALYLSTLDRIKQRRAEQGGTIG